MGDVIEALEGPIGITECARLPGSCEHEPVCPVRSRLQEISGAVREFLLGIPLFYVWRAVGPKRPAVGFPVSTDESTTDSS